ncbi:FabD lysophospholipase-like protein [Mycena vulgaris]|nr:FabD lysophospholipase-like protein [Mycena vulgaris]
MLSELLILERMMYRIQQIQGPQATAPFPWQYFELIGGSGTGGIIALMLGRLRMSIPDAISAHEKLRPQSKRGSAESFRASKFEGALKETFKLEKMGEIGLNSCKTFVCAINQMNMNVGQPQLFRSYDTPKEPAIDCMMWEAARATSATPGLFKSMEIRRPGAKQRYIDGGVGNNNPTSLVLAEAEELYESRRVVLVVNIGSGHPDTIQLPKSWSPSAFAKIMNKIATDCERTHEHTSRKFKGIPNAYFRFNVQQGMPGIAPQDWEKSGDVAAHTNRYLGTEEAKSKITDSIEGILNPVIPVSTSSAPVYLKVCPPPTGRFTGREGILRRMTE